MEESISSSEDEETVGKSRKRRMHKRWHLNSGGSILSKLYNTSEEVIKTEKIETVVATKPVQVFKDQMLMVAGDQYEENWPAAALLSQSQLGLPSGFHKSDQLLISKIPPYVGLADSESPNEITESELLQVCELAEAQISKIDIDMPSSCSPPTSFSPRNTVNETPPQNEKRKNKSIVELILEDFCSSPSVNVTPSPVLLPDSETAHSETPVFRFSGTEMHTYACKRRSSIGDQSTSKKIKIAQQLERRFEPQNDRRRSRSSSLSEQEDLSQQVLPISLVNLSNSQQLTDNLLNLSAYFGVKSDNSTNSVKTVLDAKQAAENFPNSMKTESPNTLNSTGTEIFFTDESDAKQETMNMPNTDAADNLENDEYKDWIKTIGKISFLINEVIDKQKSLSSISYQPIGSEEKFLGFALKTDSAEDVLNEIPILMDQEDECSIQSLNNQEKIDKKGDTIELDDMDEWNDDCSFLIDFKTENIYGLLKKEEIATTIVENTFPKVERQSKSETLQEFETNALANIQFSEWFYNENEKNDSAEDDNAGEHDTTFIESHELIAETIPTENIGFQTANKKTINVTEEAKMKAARILEDLPSIPIAIETVKSVPEVFDAEFKMPFNETRNSEMLVQSKQKVPETLVAFQTAGKNPIKVTEEAKMKANHILEVLPNIPATESKTYFKETRNEFAGQAIQKAIDYLEVRQEIPNGLVGFQTAGRKPIKVTEKAKMKAARIFEDLPDIPISNETSNYIKAEVKDTGFEIDHKATKNEMILKQRTKKTVGFMEKIQVIPDNQVQSVGFQTASSKLVKVSETAKLRANRLLQDLLELDDNLPMCSKVVSNSSQNERDQIIRTLSKTKTSTAIPQILCSQIAAKNETKISEEIRLNAALILENLQTISEQNKTTLIKTVEKTEGISETDLIPKAPHTPLINCTKVSTSMSANKMRANSLDFRTTATLTVEDSKHIKSKLNNEILNASETPQRNGIKLLCKSLSANNLDQRLPLNRIDNGGQLMASARNPVILRRNLLSLTKRKNVNISSTNPLLRTTNALAPGAIEYVSETPLKLPQKHNEPQSPATPCLKDFFDAVESTSTPQRDNPLTPATTNDISGLQHIQWDNPNDSSTSRDHNRSLETVGTNVKSNSNSKQLTPKQRIACLSMYGKPPPVSPISVLGTSSNTCRPSGLRRRSARQIVINSNKQ